MRNLFAIALLIILSAQSAVAFTTTSTGSVGNSPAVHGPRIAFLTFEDAIDQESLKNYVS